MAKTDPPTPDSSDGELFYRPDAPHFSNPNVIRFGSANGMFTIDANPNEMRFGSDHPVHAVFEGSKISWDTGVIGSNPENSILIKSTDQIGRIDLNTTVDLNTVRATQGSVYFDNSMAGACVRTNGVFTTTNPNAIHIGQGGMVRLSADPNSLMYSGLAENMITINTDALLDGRITIKTGALVDDGLAVCRRTSRFSTLGRFSDQNRVLRPGLGPKNWLKEVAFMAKLTSPTHC